MYMSHFSATGSRQQRRDVSEVNLPILALKKVYDGRNMPNHTAVCLPSLLLLQQALTLLQACPALHPGPLCRDRAAADLAQRSRFPDRAGRCCRTGRYLCFAEKERTAAGLIPLQYALAPVPTGRALR